MASPTIRPFRLPSLVLQGIVMLSFVILTALSVAGAASVIAQVGPPRNDIPTEDVTVRTGDIVELLGVHDDPTAQFTWVLSRDRTFIQAGRAQVFRVRIVEEGTYRLDASALGNGMLQRRTIFLNVLPRDPAEGETENAGEDGIVATDPPLSGGRILLPPDRQVLRLLPLRGIGAQRYLDLDARTDANDDGDPANDDQGAGTFFTTTGTPLFLWFSAPDAAREMRLVEILGDGTSASQTLTVIPEGASDIPPEPASPVIAQAQPDGAIRFSLPLAGQPSDMPLLFHWSFGDGTESLRTEPTHLYARSGTYDVTVTVRDLRNGQVTFQSTRSLAVEAYVPGTETSSASSAAPASSSAPGGISGGSRGIGGRWVAYLTIAILLAGVVVLGALGVRLLSRLTSQGGGLQRTLEEMETKIVRNGKEGAIDIAPPMEIRRSAPAPEAPVAQEPEREEETPPEPAPPPEPPAPPPEPPVDLDEAPAWLKKGLDAADTPAEPTPPTPETEREAPAVPAQEESPAAPPPPMPSPEPPPEAFPPLFPPEEPAPSVPDTTPAPPVPATPEPAPPPLFTEPPAPEKEHESPVAEFPPAPEALLKQEAPSSQQQAFPPAADAAGVEKEGTDQRTSMNNLPPTAEAVDVGKKNESPAATPSAPPQPSPEEQARAEKERERRRIKRKRYRENLKKRKQSETVAPSPSQTPEQRAFPPVAGSEGAEKESASPVAAPPPSPAVPLKQEAPSEQQAFPPVADTEGVEKESTNTETTDQTPVTAPAPSVPQTTPEPAAPEKKPNDDNVVFVVEAPNLRKDQPPANGGNSRS
ncbi:MAG: PKD domain-containing protein [Candidatus Peribacteraceae bacterium]|nr:PKD domain-containing protein [Candidatus Peribacteraceae bacterium]